MIVDVVVDVQRGDCGKGKISKCLIEEYGYDIVAKYNGGGNAGHAVWIDENKFTAHYLTSGIYFPNTKIIIGPGCVVNPEEFLTEYNSFNEHFKLDGRVFIHPYAHIIQSKHIEVDDVDNKIGTTKKGIGPAYSDKYNRTGIRAENCPELKQFLITDKRFIKTLGNPNRILMEGSQGWWLDIDWGKYPYVTSSHIHPAFAFATFGISLSELGTVFGVCKPYETYVGSSEDEVHCSKEDEELLRTIGHEYGETTGRARKIGYLQLDNLIEAINRTGVDCLIFNKMDVVEETKIFKLFKSYISNYNFRRVYTFHSVEDFKNEICKEIKQNCPSITEIIFSGSKQGDDISGNLP